MIRKDEVYQFNQRHAESKFNLKDEMIKYNKTRTRLLLLVDSECNRYIKECKVRFNSELPREINRHFEESCTISFSNPIVTNYNNKKVVKFSNKAESSNPICVDELKDSLKLTTNQRVFDFGKCMNEIGKEFIDRRKISVSYKKFDLINIKNLNGMQLQNPSINLNSATMSGFDGLSIIQVNNDMNMKSTLSNGKTRRLSSRRFIFPDMKKYRLEDIIPNKADKEEKEAKRIQEKFNKLQNLADKLKNAANNSKRNIQHEESMNITKFNGELFDILKFKGLKFESKLIKDNCKKNKHLEAISKKDTVEKDKFRQNADNRYIKNIPTDSDRISDETLKSIPIKISANSIMNPFSKAGDKALNSNEVFLRRDMRSKPIARTTKESGKLAAIIKKIRENLFKINQRNSQDSSYLIAGEQDQFQFEGNIKPIKRNKIKTPFTNYNSKRNSTNTQSKQNFYQNSDLQELYEVDKKLFDSSLEILSDSDINSRISSCSNLYQTKSPFENNNDNYNLNKGNLLNLINNRDANKFRSLYHSNLSKNSEVSRCSNSNADSVSCSFISKDPSNITPSSMSKSEISNDFDCDVTN